MRETAVSVLAGLLNLLISFSLSLGDLAALVLTAAAGWEGGWGAAGGRQSP